MKRLVFLISSFIFIPVMLISCTPKSSDEDEKVGNLLDKIKNEGSIRIGTEGTYAPFTFHDKDGNLVGFDIDIANEVAKRIGVKAEYIETKWDGMFAGLDAERFDAIANQVGIKPERQEKYDFSDPYIVSKAVLIVNNDNTDIKKFEDLSGKKSAQSLTSNLADIAKKYGATIVQADGFNQSIDLLTSKRVDATVNDSLSFYDLTKQKPNLAVKIVAEYQDADKCGIMFRKNNTELVAAVNKALVDMKEDGTYLKISEKWFGTDVSK